MTKKSTPPANSPVKVLYRKYRPTKLEDVVGQEQVTRVLANSLEQGKIGHAYLFIGPRGTGKTSVARIFAHAVNGFEYQVEDSYLDIIEIDAASNTGVDNIRELREKAVIAPTKGKYKVYIIDEVHMLTKSASNALLKTLEEPPEHVIFIMATTDAHKVPITISSRTQVHTFRLADPETMFQHLRQIADTESIPIDDDALKIVVRRGGGSFRDSLSLLDQIASLATSDSKTSRITADLLSSVLGLPQEQIIEELLAAYEDSNGTKIHDLLQNLLNTGVKPEVLAAECITKILSSPRTSLLSLLSALPEVKPPFPEAKLLLAFLSPSKTTPELYPSLPPKPLKTPPSPLKSENSIPKHLPKAPTEPSETSSQPRPETPTKKPSIQPSSGSPITPKTAPAPTSAPSTLQTSQTSTISTEDFNWGNFINAIRETSTAIASQLQRVDYEIADNALHLFPSTGFIKKFLDKPANAQVLAQNLPNITLIVHEVSDHKSNQDGTISQISAIMGGVQEVKKDEMPF